MSETPFQITTRQGIEKTIREASAAGDANLSNAQLDLWPYGRERPPISVEQAHHIATAGLAHLEIQYGEAA